MCLLLIGLVNTALCLVFALTNSSGASNYLLAIFFLNLALYGAYYCTMKLLHGERINKVPALYAVLGSLCFLPALYFFIRKEKITEVSPAESRSIYG